MEKGPRSHHTLTMLLTSPEHEVEHYDKVLSLTDVVLAQWFAAPGIGPMAGRWLITVEGFKQLATEAVYFAEKPRHAEFIMGTMFPNTDTP